MGCLNSKSISADERDPPPESGVEVRIPEPVVGSPEPHRYPILILDTPIQQVIPHVCKFLRVKDVKRCRLVSKSWNDSFTPILKERTTVRIVLDPPDHDEYEDLLSQKEKYSDVVAKMAFSPVNIALVISDSYQFFLPPRDPEIFLSVKNLKYVFVMFLVEDQMEWKKDLVLKIIQNSAATLQKLKFLWDDELAFRSLRGTVFPKLIELEAKYTEDEEYVNEEALENIGYAITESFPRLECLKMESRDLNEIAKMGFLPKFPLSLHSLELSGDLDSAGMALLLQIPGPLKGLAFGPIFLDRHDNQVDEVPMSLYKFLKKHSSTLEMIFIGLVLRDRDDDMQWRIPTFPKMKDFGICTGGSFKNFEFETSLGNFARIDYERCFPVLESLSVTTLTKDISGVVAFFPEEGNVCRVKSVRKVLLEMHEMSNTGGSHFVLTGLYKRLVELFPDARRSVIHG